MNKANLNTYIYIIIFICVSHLRVIRTMKAIRHMPSVGAAPPPPSLKFPPEKSNSQNQDSTKS